MSKIEREDIHTISRYSNWSEKSIEKLLKEEVYSSKASWQKFLRLFFISLGVGFTVAGIIFFFAYNWADLHKFIKLGLIEGLLLAVTFGVLLSQTSTDFKHIMLTGAALLVGVLFAVFGQVYQTGANAYDFFLGWTMFIALWVAISNYAPLWLIFITLVNTTLLLYWQQEAQGWSEVFVFTMLLVFNGMCLIISLFGSRFVKTIKAPIWFTNLLALAAVAYSTIGITIGLFDEIETNFFLLIIISSLLYGIGVWYGLRRKRGFYLAIVPFSIIIIISTFLIKLSDDAGMFFFISCFTVASVTLVIKYLIDLQKQWMNA